MNTSLTVGMKSPAARLRIFDMKYCVLFKVQGKTFYLKNSALESLGFKIDQAKRNDPVLFDTRREAEAACTTIKSVIVGEIEE